MIKSVSKRPIFFRNTFFFALAVLFLFLVSAISGLYLYIGTNEGSAANFTDNIVRPVLGNKATISLEAFFFNIDDHINQLKYTLAHSDKTNTAFADSKEAITPTATPSAAPIFESFDLTPITATSDATMIAGEGIWQPIKASTISGVLLAKTFLLPDKERPYAIVTMVKLNMQQLNINIVAGTKQPGGPQKPGPGIIPTDIQKSNLLVAGFNGGFQQKDGQYGMIVGDDTYLPRQKHLATLVMYQDKEPQIIEDTGQAFGNDVVAIRQNCPMLLKDGKIVTSSGDWNMQTWGLTTTNTMYTWRSGLGVTKNGNLIYASGPSLIPETLAKALWAAGAVNAMQLDINPFWVRFVTFTPLGNEQYQSSPLDANMVNGGYEYLHGYQKDFFYVYKK